MSEPFLAEVKIIGFNFAPRGWAQCDGQILPINQNQSLYSLLGTTYGGDGRTSFALPDLRSRTPIHVGRSPGGGHHELGSKSGEESHFVSMNEMPQHSHSLRASSSGYSDSDEPTNTVWGTAAVNVYHDSSSNQTAMAGGSLLNTGGGQAHNNMQPYLVLNYVIALQGLFPSRN